MKSLTRFLARLGNLAAGRHGDDRLREEIEEHIALQTEENIRSGMSLAEARRQAALKFGGVEGVKEEYRAQRGFVFVETWLQDARYAIRTLRKSPSFSTTAVLTLAVAIGANAVSFSALNALILRPLNLPESQSLYGLQRVCNHFPAQSYPDYLDLRDRNRGFESLAAFNVGEVGLETDQESFPAFVYEVSGNYFDALRVQPYLGRFFESADERGADSAPYVVLTYSYWHTHFQDDRTVIGRAVRLNKHPFTVVGVAPPGFKGTVLFLSPDVFVPMVQQGQIDGSNLLNARDNRWVFMVLGHLKPGVTPAQAVADLNSVGSWLEKNYPKDDAKMSFELVRPGLFGDYIGRPAKRSS